MSTPNVHVARGIRSVSLSGARRIDPVHIWASFGAVMVIYLAWLFGSWIAGPDFVTNTIGRAESPAWVVRAARITEVLSFLTFLVTNYFFVYRPWRRNGQLGTEGMLVIACASLYWLDNCMNYTSYFAQLNSNFVNYGNWVNNIPGWQTPNMGKMPEAVIAWGFAYSSWFVLLPMLAGSWLMRWFKSRYPSMSTFELVAVAYLAMVAFDFLLEGTLVRFHLYTYGGAIRSWSLWAGEIHQFPIYEALLWGGAWTLFTCLYHFRDDKGLTWVERGAERLSIGGRKVKFVRLLALVGAVNAVFLLYAAIINYIQLNGDAFPDDMPPYLVAGLCGDGSAYACPDPALPLARRSAPTNRTIPAEELQSFTNP